MAHKVILLGPTGVGKTSLINSYVSGDFNDATKPTLGLGYVAKVVDACGEPVPLEIWDTAGQERFRSLSQLHFRDSSAVLLVFRIIDKSSLDDLNSYVKALAEQTNAMPALFVVGNMVDRDAERAVEFDQGSAFATKILAEYFETSAKTGDGIKDLFMKVAIECRGRGPPMRVGVKRVQLAEAGGGPEKSSGADAGCC
jgi:small GTP-binding protein